MKAGYCGSHLRRIVTSGADKLDAPSRHLLAQLEASGAEGDQAVGVLLGGRGGFVPSQLDALRADGVQVETVAGDVLGATVPLAKLPAVARHDFVVSVQLSLPLRPDAPDQSTASYYDVE
jgi:hypothetical protein